VSEALDVEIEPDADETGLAAADPYVSDALDDELIEGALADNNGLETGVPYESEALDELDRGEA